MDDLKAFYDKIENPIDNKNKWNRLINMYSSSYDFNDFYQKVTYVNKSTNPYYITDDKERFSLLMWSLWKKSVLGLSEEKIKYYISKNVFNQSIYDVLNDVFPLDSIKEYSKLKEVLLNDNIRGYFSKFFYENEGNVTLASSFDILTDYTYNTVFTITVGGVNLYKFLLDFTNSCLENEINFYIKYNEFGKYINVNIYSTIDNLKRIEKIISVIKKENFAFHYDNIYNLLSGDIDDNLSIRNRAFYNPTDYNNNRCLVLFKSFDSVIYNYVINHLNILVSFKEGRMNLLDYISYNVTDRVIHQLISKSVKTEADYYNIANSRDLSNLRKYINEKVSLNLKDVLADKLYLKNNDDKIIVKLNDEKSLDIEVSVYMYAIRTLTETLLLKDNAIEKAFKIRIKNECEYQKIDPNKFCLDKTFSNRILIDETKIKGYEEELSSIQTEINRLNELEKLFEDGSPEARQQLSVSMKEMSDLFEE